MIKFFEKSSVMMVALIFLFSTFTPVMSATVNVPSGLSVLLEVTNTVSSENANVGDRVNLRVVQNVTYKGNVVIAAGSSATGKVISATKSGIVGKAGEIGIQLISVKSVNDTNIALSATQVIKGEDSSTIAVLVGLFLCCLAFFMSGGSATIQAGSTIEAVTISDFEIDV